MDHYDDKNGKKKLADKMQWNSLDVTHAMSSKI